MKLKTTIQDLTFIFIGFIALHLFLLPFLCSNSAYSIYFKNVGKNYEKEHDFHEDVKNRIKNHDMAIIVQTSDRKTSYRNKTLLSIHTELMRTNGGHTVYVCSADGSEKSLNMPVISYLKSLQPCIIQTEDCRNASEEKDKEKKIVKDFVLCHEAIENEINEDVKYLLWLEDDVILMEDFFSTLSAIMSFRKLILQSQKWLDLKLYLNPRLRGIVKLC